MKRYIKAFVILLTAVISLDYASKTVYAEEDLSINKWKVEADLQENGDLEIVEDITFQFNEEFNGVFRDVLLKDTSGISTIKVQELQGASLIDFALVDDADNGDSGVYTVKLDKKKALFKIYAPSRNQKRTFRISYKVKNVAVRYRDIGELYYKFVGDENGTPIDKLVIRINLPQKVEDNQVKIFAHGPLNGTISKVDNQIFLLEVDRVAAETFVEGRVLFPKELISSSNRFEDIDNYSNILQEEEAYQTKLAKDQARKAALREYLTQATLWVSGLGFSVFIIYLYRFRRRNVAPVQEGYTSIPKDCTPAIAAQITGIPIGTNAIFATILDLMRKGYLRMTTERDSYIGASNYHVYTIEQIRQSDEALLGHERYFIHWMIHEVGNGTSVSSKDIEYCGKHSSTKFYSAYTKWRSKVKSDTVQMGYYDKGKTKVVAFFGVLSGILFIIGLMTAISGSLYSLISIGCAVILFIYSIILATRLSDFGYEQYRKWVSFKKAMIRFRPDYTDEDAIETLDTSLIYGLALNVLKKPDKVALNEGYSMNSWIFWYWIFVDTDNNAFRKSIDHSIYAGGATSSGGGFSGGDGGGAGGGGAGGF